MKKSIKILSILFIVLLFVTTVSLATDINMNLSPNTANNNTTYSTSNTITSNSTTTYNETNTMTNSALNTNNVTQTANEVQNQIQDSILSTTQSTSVSTVSSNDNNTLSFSNILNIILIAVGVVLILLGIAILIRMH